MFPPASALNESDFRGGATLSHERDSSGTNEYASPHSLQPPVLPLQSVEALS
jgi:hypothetical protein